MTHAEILEMAREIVADPLQKSPHPKATGLASALINAEAKLAAAQAALVVAADRLQKLSDENEMVNVLVELSNNQTSLFPIPFPKSTSFNSVHGSISFRSPLKNVMTGVANRRKVADTIVGPAFPVPAVKKE